METVSTSATNFFLEITPQHRENLRKHLEQKVEIETDRYVPDVYPIHHKTLAGKRKPYPTKMPWMLPIWQRSLAELVRVMSILEEARLESLKPKA